MVVYRVSGRMNNWTQNSMPLECHALNRTIIGMKGVSCRFRIMNGSTLKSTYNKIEGQGLIELRGHGRGNLATRLSIKSKGFCNCIRCNTLKTNYRYRRIRDKTYGNRIRIKIQLQGC